MSDTFTISPAVDPDERAVEEVHCIECGAPISSIPNWYATVNVRFTCDTCRQKSPRLGQSSAAAPSAIAGDSETTGESGILGDADPDLALDDVEIEDDTEDISLDEVGDVEEE